MKKKINFNKILILVSIILIVFFTINIFTSVENNTITISAGYVIECFDYIINQATGETVRGDSNRNLDITYVMKFRKTLDQNQKVDKCPSCGAPIEMNSAGICSFCRTKLVTENTDWVLTEKNINYQRSASTNI